MSNKAAAILAGTAVVVGVLIGRASASTGGPSTPKPKQVTGQAVDPAAYPRTKAGAATASQAYVAALFQGLFTGADQRRVTVETISSKAMRTEIAKQEDESADLTAKVFDLPKDMDHVVERIAPLGYRVISFTSDSARVDVWTVGVIGKPGEGHGVIPQFKTFTVPLAGSKGGGSQGIRKTTRDQRRSPTIRRRALIF